MRFSTKVAILGFSGAAIRHVPGAMASAMVTSGAAAIHTLGGRVREVRLLRTAASMTERTGEPSGLPFGTKFTRWEYLPESGARVIEHHPRCVWGLED